MWVHAQVMSGGQPQGADGYAALQRLGMRTIISVDGVRPDAAAARAHQLQLIHLPHGYDGISAARRKELAHAFLTAPRPIYVHCHHGVHRSPAAAAAGCIVAGLITPDAGPDVLRMAGTSADYAGLWDAVRQAAPINAKRLAGLNIRFTEFEPPPPLVHAMGRLESITERLEQQLSSDSANRQSEAGAAAAQALLLREEFAEMSRLDVVRERPDAFRSLLTASEDQATRLTSILKSGDSSESALEAQQQPGAILGLIRRHCRDCHRQFRD